MIFFFRIGPVFFGAGLTILAGWMIFARSSDAHILGGQVMGAVTGAIGILIILSMLRHIWRAFWAFFH